MKKIYSKPEMGVQVIELTSYMQTTSPTLPTNDGPAVQGNGMDAKRRRGGIFDTEEDARNSIW